MSNITTVLLSPGAWVDDAAVVAELNARLRELPLHPEAPGYWALKNISEASSAWGGTKSPPALYAGALNGLPFDEFARIVAGFPWSVPEAVQMMVMFEQDDTYRVLTIADLRTAGESLSRSV
ncbi:MAG: hypothetical protein LBV60_02700 [Streptomyces sp.]|nr:hypothetical protein [Streptomyces sp.]